MDFFAVYWPAFVAALTANLLTVGIVYAVMLKHRGSSLGEALTKAGGTMLLVSWRAVQIYIGLLFVGGIAYAIKLIVVDGLH